MNVVTAITDGYASNTVRNVTVYGGDVTWVDIAMGSNISEPSTPGQGNDSSGRDYQCFIATTAYGSPMAEQVQMLCLEMNTFFLVPSAQNWFPCITPQENRR